MRHPPPAQRVFALLLFACVSCRRGAARPREHAPSVAGISVAVESATSVQTIEGTRLRAFLVAYDAQRRLPGLTPAQKDVSNYTVQIQEMEHGIRISLLPRVQAGEFAHGENARGREAQYVVDRTTFRIIKTTYFE